MSKNWYKKYTDLKASDELYTEIRRKIKKLEAPDHVDVSIVMVAYNEEKRILPSICSLANLNTSYSVEIIVVNNNSTDNTQQIIGQCGVHAVFQPVKGIGNARQAGLLVARGKYHLCADSDTLYPPTYVDGMVAALDRPGVVAAYCPCSFLADGEKSATSLAIYERFRDLALWFRFIKRPELSIGAASLAFYTEPARKIGWKTNIRRGTDGALTNELKKVGKIAFVTDRRVKIKTTSRTLDSDGGMFSMIVLRIKRETLRIKEYFITQKSYDDEDTNLLK